MLAIRTLRHLLRIAAVVLGLAGALVATPASAGADLTDLWWNPSEPGWGVNFVQADSFIFATFFVYGSDNKPVWYSAQMSRDNNGTWKGPVYLSSGSYYGTPYSGTLNNVDQVGDATFAPATEASGLLTYNIGSVNVNKIIQRQTLINIDFSGTYMGALVTDVYNCNDARAVVTQRRFIDVGATQTASGPDRIDVSFATGGACSFSGVATQAGRLFRMDNATYTCGVGPATIYELKVTSLGLEGRWTAAVAGGCTEYGVFSTVNK